ncbi:MAG: ribonuclease III [Myxococcota bacterium]
MSLPGSMSRVLGYAFRNQELLEKALTHASYAHETGCSGDNERLEYLGDAVLGLVIARDLYAAHPDWNEGQLTRARAALVNRRTLADRARELQLGRWVRLGGTERHGGGENKDSILANCLEAVLGAIFLDGGLEPAAKFLDRVFGASLEVPPQPDAKTQLNELAHARFKSTPLYRGVGDTQVQNDDERFNVEVWIDGEPWGRGVGRSKQAAERAAAEAALRARLGADD